MALVSRLAPPRPLRRQAGQAMVFATVTALLILLAAFSMYSAGQLTTQRIKMQNTADAAAYSAAVMQARSLNFASYMNRAIIANHVAIGQIVSITSWIRNFDDVHNGEFSSIAETIANLSSLSAMYTAPANVYGGIASTLKSVIDPVAPILVKALDALIWVQFGLAEAFYVGMTVVVPEVAHNVVQANDPAASISVPGMAAIAIWAIRHNLFASVPINPTKGKDGDDRFANVVNASQDLFFKNRTLPLSIWPTPFLIDPVRLFQPGFGPLLMLHFHGGGSVMKTGSTAGGSNPHVKSWGAVDATGLFVIMCLTINILGIPIPIPFPLPPLPSGSGAAAAGTYSGSYPIQIGNYINHRNPLNDGDNGWAGVEFGAVQYHPMTAVPYWIKVGEGPGTNMSTMSGLRPYMELRDNFQTSGGKTTAKQADVTKANTLSVLAPPFVVEIERPMDTVDTTSSPKFRIGGGVSGDLDLSHGAASDKLRALARSEAYFSRPSELFPRGIGLTFNGLTVQEDGKTEYGSLYNPYWQPRLAANGLLEQIGSLGATALFDTNTAWDRN